MAAISKSDLTRLLTLLVVVFTALQGVVPTMPMDSLTTKIIISAVLMFLVISFTAWKQYVSVEIRNGSIWPTLIIAIVAILGGLNDLINAVPISPFLGQWIRFCLTTLVMILNISSKTLYPTPESKEVEGLKSELSVDKNTGL